MRSLAVLLAPLCAVLALGCTDYLPPVQSPAAEQPTLAEAHQPTPDHGLVVIDVVDGPSDVFQLTPYAAQYRTRRGRLRTVTRTASDHLCTSPCAVELPYGRYLLGFPMHGAGRRLERAIVDVTEQPTVYRRALGNYWGAGAGLPLGIVGATFGGMAMVVGVVLLPVGASQGSDGMLIAGGINLGVGAALLVAGILGMALDRNLEQPGSGVSFPLQLQAQPPPPQSPPPPQPPVSPGSIL